MLDAVCEHDVIVNLLETLRISSGAEIDPARPLQLGALELGSEAAAEACRILDGGDFPQHVHIDLRNIDKPLYWSLAHKTAGAAEIFGFPSNGRQDLPTAIEIALVRAIAATAPDQRAAVLGGNAEISIGEASASSEFRKVIRFAKSPMVGTSLLLSGATQVILAENVSDLLNRVALQCLENSFRTSPLKFRFLELYRLMEARFLSEIENKLISRFGLEPSDALSEAAEALKSELKQIIGLAETQKDAFESCWAALDEIKNTNQFVAALFRKLKKKRPEGSLKWELGAALIYQIRCAVVHSGEKDMIFESFPDGESALEVVLPPVERAALLLVGIELVFG